LSAGVSSTGDTGARAAQALFHGNDDGISGGAQRRC
jgi:hypothetical protein